MRIHLFALAAAAAALVTATDAKAGIIDSTNVTIGGNSYRTFIDDTTGLRWLDLDNFWDASTYDSITALLAGSGYHLATLTDLLTLQASIPAIPANFPSETLISGGNYFGNPDPGADRELMWGIYEDGDPTNGVSWSWKFGSEASWDFTPDIWDRTFGLEDANVSFQDLGAWIVADAVDPSDVPEPTTLALAGLGVAGLAGYGWRRKRAAA